METNHIHGIKDDNRKTQLEYCTHADNIKHAHRIGLCKKMYGEDIFGAKLTNHEVYLIKSMIYNTRYTQEIIANIFHVVEHTISDIKCGRSWKHVKYPNDNECVL
jgi:hypothetical protein